MISASAFDSSHPYFDPVRLSLSPFTTKVTSLSYPSLTSHPSSSLPSPPQKSNKDSPTWYLVDVTFKSRVAHPVTLALLKSIAAASSVASLSELGLGDWFGEEELNRESFELIPLKLCMSEPE